MLLLLSVRVGEWPSVWVTGVHSVYRTGLSFIVNVYQFVCVPLSLLVLRVGCGI